MIFKLARRAGLGLVTALALTLAGCAGTDTDSTGDNASSTGDNASLALASSADALAETSFRFEMEMGEMMSATGAVDPAAGIGSTVLTTGGPAEMSMDMEIRFTNDDMWMNLGDTGAMLGVDYPWMHIDMARLGADGVMGFGPGQDDPASAAALLEALEQVEQIDERTYRAEADLTQVDSGFAGQYTEMLNRDAASLTVTINLDDAGRLETISMELPSVGDLPAQTLSIRYFDYGTQVDVTAPPADQVGPAPDLVYGMIGA